MNQSDDCAHMILTIEWRVVVRGWRVGNGTKKQVGGAIIFFLGGETETRTRIIFCDFFLIDTATRRARRRRGRRKQRFYSLDAQTMLRLGVLFVHAEIPSYSKKHTAGY